MTPSVSVLMPVYNAARYVAEAIESILAQTFTDFEFIIVDDGSTDGSLRILKNYAARDTRIRLISRPNTGYVQALNEMLGLARGEYIARMDADDIALPERFQRQVEFLTKRRECVAVGTVAMLIDSDGDPLCLFQQVTNHESIDQRHLEGAGGAIVHPSLMARREAMIAIGCYRPEFSPAEDLDLFLRLAESGRLANLSEMLFKYRRHALAIGYTQHREQVDAKNRAIAEARARRGLRSIPVSIVESGIPTISDQHRTWAWWALCGGHTRSARKHALIALRRSPWKIGSWRLAFCAYRSVLRYSH